MKSKAETVGQMRSISQEKDIKIKENIKIESQTNPINSFDELLKLCSLKKEIKLKYELEKNVNLVSFESKRIEISFNEDLDKDFVKDLSSRLYDWTKDRWIITLSKIKGEPSKKQKEVNLKNELIKSAKNSSIYKEFLKKFPDAELVDVEDTKKIKND
jgi:DNA polymerase-3 subunit gamma/tau